MAIEVSGGAFLPQPSTKVATAGPDAAPHSGVRAARLLAALPTLVAVIVTFALVGAAFLMGIERRMDQKIAWGPLNDVWHLSVAISRDFYGLHGYVGFEQVQDTLQHALDIKSWNASTRELPAITDAATINAALSKAASIAELRGLGRDEATQTLQAFHGVRIGNVTTSLMAPIGEDLGSSAFYALSFRLFGLRIQSAYFLFYVLFGLSVIAFVAQFYRSSVALTILLFNVFALEIFFYTNFFSSALTPTVYLNRFASTLSIIPACHYLFLLLERRRISIAALILAGLQLSILMFGIFIRSSSNWVLLAIFAAFAGMFIRSIVQANNRSITKRLTEASRTLRFWPIILLLCGVAGLGLYVSKATHPIYHTLDDPPHHMRWHSAWLGLSIHPDWHKYYPELPVMADATGFWLTREHLHALGRDDEFNSRYTRWPNIGLHELYIREQFLEFARHHPMYVLEAVFYYKPIAFYRYISDVFSSSDYTVIVPILAALLAAAMLAAAKGTSVSDLRRLVGIAALMYAFSLAPVLWAYPAPHIMADEIWTTALVGLAILWASLVAIAHLLRLASRKFWPTIALAHRIQAHSRLAFAVPTTVILGLIAVLILNAQMKPVNVQKALYAACGSNPTNETDDANLEASAQCYGTRRCIFHANQSGSCTKFIDLSWRCGATNHVNEMKIPINSRGAYDATITCPQQSGGD